MPPQQGDSANRGEVRTLVHQHPNHAYRDGRIGQVPNRRKHLTSSQRLHRKPRGPSDNEVEHVDDSKCEYIELVAFVEEILDYADSQSQGQKHGDTTLWFPVYYAQNLKLAGAYTESAVLTHDDDECVISGIYSFNYDTALEGGMFKSSITQQSSCASVFGAITGGTGKYHCATGFQAFYEDVSSHHFVALKLYLCQNACTSYGDY